MNWSRALCRETVTKRVDFSGNATVYDRRHGASLSEDAARRLWLAAGLQSSARVLDIGAGTGRVSVAIAVHAREVVALEPAPGMVTELRDKVGRTNVSIVVGEGGRLPFSTGRFGAVAIARLLYLTPDWQEILSEAHRVLATGGWLLHEWGNGVSDEPWVQIREEARRLFEQGGVEAPFHPGVRSEGEVHQSLLTVGFSHEVDVAMGPGPGITLREFLRRLVDGELSYVWAVPDSVRRECLPLLVRWSEQTFDLEQTTSVPREVSWSLYRRDAA